MSGLVLAGCPEGYKENDRTGQCKVIPGFKEKVKAEKKEQELKASLATLSPGKFVKYLDVSWITTPMDTEEAIDFYFKDRQLDPIEGAWHDLPSDYEIVIVKNRFGIASEDQYIGIFTDLGPDHISRWESMQVGLVQERLNQIGDNPFYIFRPLWHSTFTWSRNTYNCHLSEDGNAIVFDNGRISHLRLYPTSNAEPEQQVAGSGTGFFVSSDGYIVTNHHVIKGANKITVTTPSGESFEAKVVSTSTSTDLALLRIPYQTKNYLTFANPGSTDIGHQVFTLGYPVSDILGKEVKYTDGAISSLSGIEGDATFFQISVPIQPGNSGGPLVNADGDVVGVVTATAAVEEFYKSVGAMPQNVNWAVKGAYASLLLPPTIEMNERPKSNPIANAKWSVVFIETE